MNKKLFDIVTLSDNCVDCQGRIRRRRQRNGLAQGWETAIPILGQILPLIFGGSVDPGHWEGSLFIPGDLQNRIAYTQQKIALSGLEKYSSQQEWLLILKTPGIWQANIDRYIDNVLRGRANGTVPMPTVNGNIPGGYGASMGGIFPVLLVGGLLWFLVSDSKKGKQKK